MDPRQFVPIVRGLLRRVLNYILAVQLVRMRGFTGPEIFDGNQVVYSRVSPVLRTWLALGHMFGGSELVHLLPDILEFDSLPGISDSADHRFLQHPEFDTAENDVFLLRRLCDLLR